MVEEGKFNDRLLESFGDSDVVKESAPLSSLDIEKKTEQGGEIASEKAENRFSDILSKVGAQNSSQNHSDDVVFSDAQSVSRIQDAESQVTELVQIASVKGVAHAVNVARKLNDFYVLDRMHDELAEKFYEALKEKGMIVEE